MGVQWFSQPCSRNDHREVVIPFKGKDLLKVFILGNVSKQNSSYLNAENAHTVPRQAYFDWPQRTTLHHERLHVSVRPAVLGGSLCRSPPCILPLWNWIIKNKMLIATDSLTGLLLGGKSQSTKRRQKVFLVCCCEISRVWNKRNVIYFIWRAFIWWFKCQILLRQILKSGDTTLTFLLPTQCCQKYLHFFQTSRPTRDLITLLKIGDGLRSTLHHKYTDLSCASSFLQLRLCLLLLKSLVT